MSGFQNGVDLVYLGGASTFVLGLHLMNSPATARKGNRLSASGMTVAIATTVAVLVHDGDITALGAIVLGVGLLVGAVGGLVAARKVQMTDMPQLVSLFNAVGGGAAALIALGDGVKHLDWTPLAQAPVRTTLPMALDVIIGAITFSGSLIAAGKLAGKVSGSPIVPPGGRALFTLSTAASVVFGGLLVAGVGGIGSLLGLMAAALVVGVLMTLPIGGADMPVVISLLNAFTGTAVAMAGFVLDSAPLVIAGALVGAAGTILTLLMAEAMNRSILNIMAGGFGTGDGAAAAGAGASGTVRETTIDDAALQLAYAHSVIIVPGYGLAAAQAQHECVELAQALEQQGVEVSYGIHPVAGRMPGHMNVLLAEANVPYPQLKDLDEVNPEFARTDVVLVVGANDVTNPAARRPGNPVSGMPILDVDQAKTVIVIKRSMASGYAGIENELYFDPKCSMLFTHAKAGLKALHAAVQQYVG